ncbi:S8 family serine peptidase [Nostoc sp. 106C]|uniref:S8 family serine peptidase n=1 Tax=Nostoc sp. 106C TaxID=1932667 RepID=UPI000A383C6E|nr:S8 family serine peptidase [Nostoc sp. 106C]
MRNIDKKAHLSMSDDLRTSHIEAIANDHTVSLNWILNSSDSGSLLDLNKTNVTVTSDYTRDSSHLVVAGVDDHHLNLAAHLWTNFKQIAGNEINGVHSWDFGNKDNYPIGDRLLRENRINVLGKLATSGKNSLRAARVSPNVSSIANNDFQTNQIKTDADNAVTPDWTPNDTYFDSLWGLKKIDAPATWDHTTGSRSVIVGVVDTGVDYTHPDLAANIWTNTREIAGNGIDDDKNGYVDDIHGWDFGDGDNNPTDDHPRGGHGTHVSGILGASGNNSLGVIGVSPNVSIMPTKHFSSSDTEGYLWDVPQGIYYAVNNKAKIINLSFGSSSFDQEQYNALKYAYDRGVLVIAAAGNSNQNTDTTPHYPANYDLPNIISVTATDENDQLAYFSNYGVNSVDLAAPGVNIKSTLPNNQYDEWNGTSMAVPYVSGAAALLLATNPNLSVLDLRYALLSSVDKLDSLQGKTNTGGRLNVLKAYQQVAGNNNPQPDSLTTTTVVASDAAKIHIEAENYNNAYDTTSGNAGGKYRRDLNVDIENTSDIGGGYDVTAIQTGEWLTYNVNISENGFYDMQARVATGDIAQKQIKVSIDNSQEQTLSFGYTGGYQTWTNASLQGMNLSAGSHELRLDILTGDFNINYIDLIPTNIA